MPVVLAAVAGQVLDFVTFSAMVDVYGASAEANPVMAFLYAEYGLPGAALLKLGLVPLIAVMVWILRETRWAWAPALVGFMGAATNCVALWLWYGS